MLSVIIPANNEADYISACLEALLGQTLDPVETGGAEVIVAANACTDATVAIARRFEPRFAERGWRLEVLDIPEGGKPNALNRADAAACGEVRAYLDADVVVSAKLMAGIWEALSRPEPAYAGGQLIVTPARSWVTQRYADCWSRLPFMTRAGVTGAGLFAVNEAGRARWGRFPAIISDDTYVRLNFSPGERHLVAEPYLWPMVEGFNALVKVRRRQDAGIAEIARHHPQLLENEGKPPMTAADHLKLALTRPVSYAVYVAVSLAVKFARGGTGEAWARGR
ncbi:MAG: glycosyltransferase [Pseudomonadota bacterium]